MSKRAYNFCAGPAALPEAVLQRAQGELLDWHGKGLSVMEMSHRSDEFVSIATKAEQDLRDLLGIPSDYKVLFLQGGASQQFAQIPLNCAEYCTPTNDPAIWCQKAIESLALGHVNWPYPILRLLAFPSDEWKLLRMLLTCPTSRRDHRGL